MSLPCVTDAEISNFLEIAEIAGLNLVEDLAGANLSSFNLRDTNFRSADLRATNLSGGDLSLDAPVILARKIQVIIRLTQLQFASRLRSSLNEMAAKFFLKNTEPVAANLKILIFGN